MDDKKSEPAEPIDHIPVAPGIRSTVGMDADQVDLAVYRRHLILAVREVRESLLDYWAAYMHTKRQPMNQADRNYGTLLTNLNGVLSALEKRLTATQEGTGLKQLNDKVDKAAIDVPDRPAHEEPPTYLTLEYRERYRTDISHMYSFTMGGFHYSKCGHRFPTDYAFTSDHLPRNLMGQEHKICDLCKATDRKFHERHERARANMERKEEEHGEEKTDC